MLAHVIGRPYETILREFEGERTLEAVAADPEGGSGDVKYHLAAEGRRGTSAGQISVSSPPTRATSRPSTPLSRAWRAPSRPTARRAPGAHEPDVALPC